MTSPSASPSAAGVTALVVRFLLEIGALVAVAVWGVHVAGTSAVQVLLAVLLPAVVAVAWGRFAAPRSAHRLRGSRYVLFEALVFGLATLALLGSGRPVLQLGFGVVALIDTVLVHRWNL